MKRYELLTKSLVVTSLLSPAHGWAGFRRQPSRSSGSKVVLAHDLAHDFGRGLDHLSASVDEGDFVLYQTGSWSVDGVTVGSDEEPRLEAAQVSNLQVVWTHDCEHGVIRGEHCSLPHSCGDGDGDGDGTEDSLRLDDEYVQFGPEQLVARLDVEGEEGEDGMAVFRLRAPLRPYFDTANSKFRIETHK